MVSFTIAGADFSSSRIAPAIERIDGYPDLNATGLVALYSMMYGTVGQPYTGPVTDVGDQHFNGSFVSGSETIQTEHGIASQPLPDVDGIFFDTGVPIDGSFTVFVVGVLLAQSTANYFTFWGPHTQFASLPLTSGSVEAGPLLNVAPTSVSTFSQILYRANGWDQAGDELQIGGLAPATTRFGVAISYDTSAGLWLITNGTNSTSVTKKDAGDALIASGARHAFGATCYPGTTDASQGEIDLAGVYARSMDVATITSILEQMRNIVRGRGVTVS